MEDQIKTLYKQLDDKTAFVLSLSKKVPTKPGTIAANWFARFWAIPDMYKAVTLAALQEAIKNQNALKLTESLTTNN